jgi:hypothetical protein
MRLLNSVLLLCALSFSAVASAESAQVVHFQPAMFGTGTDAIGSHLQCPSERGAETPVVVFCQTRVKASGKPRRSYCFAYDSDLLAYQSLTNRALDRSTFVPASVDGKSVEVLSSFRVAFSWKGDTCTFAAIPNWGFDDAAFGSKYSAPQEIVTKPGTWRERTNLSYRPATVRRSCVRGASQPRLYFMGNLRTGLVFSVSVLVSAEGEPSDARVERDFCADKLEIAKSLLTIQQSKFIPAFVDGKPMSMRYFDVLFLNPDY